MVESSDGRCLRLPNGYIVTEICADGVHGVQAAQRSFVLAFGPGVFAHDDACPSTSVELRGRVCRLRDNDFEADRGFRGDGLLRWGMPRRRDDFDSRRELDRPFDEPAIGAGKLTHCATVIAARERRRIRCAGSSAAIPKRHNDSIDRMFAAVAAASPDTMSLLRTYASPKMPTTMMIKYNAPPIRETA